MEKKTSKINTTAKKAQETSRRPRKKQCTYESGSYRQKIASDFLFMPWPANKKFFDRLAEDYLEWALNLAAKVRSKEFDPAENLHSLTVGEFFEQAGIPDVTFRSWLKQDDAAVLNEAHHTVKNILGRLRESMALFNKADAVHIRTTLGNYSQEYRDEREWLSKLADSNHAAKGTITILTTPIPNSSEVPHLKDSQ